MGGERAPNRELFLLCLAELSRPVIVAHPNCRCPLWVKSRHVQRKRSCPLYPQSRHVQCTRRCPLCAKSELMHRSKQHLLFDHIVGTGEQRGRDFEAKRLRGFEIDHQLEFGWLLDRQVGRRPLEPTGVLTGGVRGVRRLFMKQTRSGLTSSRSRSRKREFSCYIDRYVA